MKKITNKIIIILSFILTILLIIGGVQKTKTEKTLFENRNINVAKFSDTTKDRISKAVLVLPKDNTIVGLNNGTGNYIYSSDNTSGKVSVDFSNIKTHFNKGIFREKVDPSLDVFVPIIVTEDEMGGSSYIALFEDRGDVVLEKSYARLGGLSVRVKEIKIIEDLEGLSSYKIIVKYYFGTEERRVQIFVTDGKFTGDFKIITN